ncbi:PIN domain-containing protein [Aeromonas cavernicola]|uniref:Ribonuclease VapC n=1 Tax=Aeromonas cavernicola TaxID=1006623 RepID=A0A2H9U8C6_9GAMM|nr:PIN domain-containing protein [Aeromonas cavernicola]PJG60229.1 VapC toxin family PIN domain ribonuclease [Aeromonas cavernicola]
MKTFMLDTCICSFIMREMPRSVLERLAAEVASGNRIVISTITYAEMRYGQIGKKASPKLGPAIDEFVRRLDGILPWDAATVDQTLDVRQQLAALGTPIGNNDAAIAAHALTAGCVLVTNNTREFSRVAKLHYEDWVH